VSSFAAFVPAAVFPEVKLIRCNGWQPAHTNVLERQTFSGFHIHYATERYQSAGLRAEKYAELTDRYDSLSGAIECLLHICNIAQRDDDNNPRLPFGG